MGAPLVPLGVSCPTHPPEYFLEEVYRVFDKPRYLELLQEYKSTCHEEGCRALLRLLGLQSRPLEFFESSRDPDFIRLVWKLGPTTDQDILPYRSICVVPEAACIRYKEQHTFEGTPQEFLQLAGIDLAELSEDLRASVETGNILAELQPQGVVKLLGWPLFGSQSLPCKIDPMSVFGLPPHFKGLDLLYAGHLRRLMAHWEFSGPHQDVLEVWGSLTS